VHSEAQRKLEAIAQAEFRLNRNNFLFEMQADVQEDMEDPSLGDSGTDNQDNVQEDMVVSSLGDSVVEDVSTAWQEYLPMQGDTATGTSSDAKSAAGQYKRSHKIWISFQASLTMTTLTRHNLSSNDLHLPVTILIQSSESSVEGNDKQPTNPFCLWGKEPKFFSLLDQFSLMEIP
jgi:hypothetical protein